MNSIIFYIIPCLVISLFILFIFKTRIQRYPDVNTLPSLLCTPSVGDSNYTLYNTIVNKFKTDSNSYLNSILNLSSRLNTDSTNMYNAAKSHYDATMKKINELPTCKSFCEKTGTAVFDPTNSICKCKPSCSKSSQLSGYLNCTCPTPFDFTVCDNSSWTLNFPKPVRLKNIIYNRSSSDVSASLSVPSSSPLGCNNSYAPANTACTGKDYINVPTVKSKFEGLTRIAADGKLFNYYTGEDPCVNIQKTIRFVGEY